MNSSAASPAKFWPAALSVYGAAVLIGVLAVSPAASYVRNQAANYARDAANQTNTAVGLLELHTAALLDPGNATYRQQLANHYIARGDLEQAVSILGATSGERLRKAQLLIQLRQPATAVTTLQGLAGADAAVARSQAYLEQGRGVSALATVQAVPGDAALVQLGLYEAVASHLSSVTALIPRATTTATRLRLQRVQSGGVGLAQELYLSGLNQSSERVLATTADSSAKYQLLAHLWLSRQPLTKTDLAGAQSAATQGLRFDPANQQLHSLLQNIATQLGDQAEAAHEQQLIDQLQSGKI